MSPTYEKMPDFRDSSDEETRYDAAEDGKALLGRSTSTSFPKYTMLSNRTWKNWGTFFQSVSLLMLLLSAAVNMILLVNLSRESRSTSQHVQKAVKYDSPFERDVGTRYHEKLINGSLEHRTLFRRSPSKEVDEAWLALGTDAGSIVIPVEEAAEWGIQKGQVQRVPEQGGGYMANVFLFHDLHCLNFIRQTSRWSWDYYFAMAGTEAAKGTAFEAFDGEEALEMHFSHCLDIIRQEIMCHANTRIYTQWWVEGHRSPRQDFSFTDQCKDFDAIQSWFEERAVDMDTALVKMRPDSVFLHDTP